MTCSSSFCSSFLLLYLASRTPVTRILQSRVQSLLASCRLQGVDPYVYLVDILQRIDTHPAFEVHLLTPRLWKQHCAATPLRSDLDRLRQ